MCGITGVREFSGATVDENILGDMTDSLAHRGPDGRGVYIHENRKISLGFRRLVIKGARALALLIRNPSKIALLPLMVTRKGLRKLSSHGRMHIDQNAVKAIVNRPCFPFGGSRLSESQLDEVEQVCRHEFRLLESDLRSLGADLPWTSDFHSGHDWGGTTSKEIKFGLDDGNDIKVPWELSRFYHAPQLAQAFIQTKNRRYIDELLFQIDDWIKKNPVEKGPNWICTMDASIRVANVCLAMETVKPFLHAELPNYESTIQRICQSLYQHGSFIESHLEYGPLISNHYLSNVAGLIYLGTFFSDMPEGRRWFAFGVSGLEECMNRQVYDDGADFEASIPYHRLVAEMFGFSALVSRHNGGELSNGFWIKLRKMFEFTRQYMKDDGRAPAIGDCDNGRFHILTQPINSWDVSDHRHLLELAHELWPDNPLSAQTSSLFPFGQIAIMRSAAFYCCVDAGQNGQDGNGGHCHNDILSFELSVNGSDVIVDPGTGCYTSRLDVRNAFRKTTAHNTVSVDGEEQNRIPDKEQGVFWMHQDASATVLSWKSSPEKDEFSARHDGYGRLSDPVIHERSFELNKQDERLIIRDSFTGKENHTLEWNFHLSPDVSVVRGEDGEWVLRANTATLRVSYPDHLSSVCVKSPHSPAYGTIVQSQSLVFTWTGVPSSRLFEFSFSLVS